MLVISTSMISPQAQWWANSRLGELGAQVINEWCVFFVWLCGVWNRYLFRTTITTLFSRITMEPLFQIPLRKVPLIERCPYFSGVLISSVSLFQGCPYFIGVLISSVSLFQGCPYFIGVPISGVSLFHWCPYFKCVLISMVSLFRGGLYFRGVLYRGVPLHIPCCRRYKIDIDGVLC